MANRVARKQAQTVGEVLQEFLKAYHLTAPLNTRRIFEAWDQASGAGRYTVRKFFRDGKLYITLNSSVVRSQLGFQKDELVRKVNAIVNDDPLFTKDGSGDGPVLELILK